MQPKRRSHFFPCHAAALLLAGVAGCSDARKPAATEPGAPPARGAARPVDTILIVIDTLRADAILDPEGLYDTPALDRLGRDGVAFPRAFSAAPMTLPSHMSLFSSRAPFETRVANNGQRVPTELPLLAEWLSENGYESRAVISLGTLNPLHPDASPSRGFGSYDVDYRDIAMGEATSERLVASLAERDASKPLFLFAHFADPHEPYDAHGIETKVVQVSLNGEVLDEVVASDTHQWSRTTPLPGGRTVVEFRAPTDKALRFLVRRFECVENGKPLPVTWEKGKIMERVAVARVVVDRGERPAGPCELRFWVNDVPRDFQAIRERYRSEVAYADRQVAELIAELERLGLYRDSLVVFTSDHGEALGEKGMVGHVESLSDEMIHVPLVVKLPDGDPRREELALAATRLATHLDVVPTILDVAGVPPLPGQRGQTLLAPHESVHLAQTHRPEARRTQLALRDARFKLVYFPADEDVEQEERFELYDLEQDPGELVDVFAQRAGERPEWPEQLRRLHRSAGSDDAQSAQDRGEHQDMLEALGYGGGDDGDV